jgi:hypothetical protein
MQPMRGLRLISVRGDQHGLFCFTVVCSRASRNVHHRQGIPYRADGEGRLDAVVEVRVEERDLLHNHWA